MSDPTPIDLDYIEAMTLTSPFPWQWFADHMDDLHYNMANQVMPEVPGLVAELRAGRERIAVLEAQVASLLPRVDTMSHIQKRYFCIDTDGPGYTTCAESPAHALRAWVDFHIGGGFQNEVGDDDNPLPSSIREMGSDEVVRRTFDDGGVTRPLTDLEPGHVLCSEF